MKKWWCAVDTARVKRSYADFDDYRHNQRVVVIVRWFMLVSWATINHWNADWDQTLLFVDLIGLSLAVMNVRLHLKLRRGQRINRSAAVAMSLFDVIAITCGLAITNRFENTFFILYYPALMGLALVTASFSLSVLFVTLAATAYATLSLALSPGIDIDAGDDRRMAARLMVMYALVIAANLIIRAERSKRAEAVVAAQKTAEENIKLLKASQDEVLCAAEQRYRIRREIHDGLAQSLYAISLNIESTSAMANSAGAKDVSDRLNQLIPVTRHALLETRHYMHDLSPMLSEQGDVRSAVENLGAEFQNISDIDVEFTSATNVDSVQPQLPPEIATQICRIVQEVLANVLRHSGATKVSIDFAQDVDSLSISVSDDGRGFDREKVSGGFGLGHIKSRVDDLGGTIEIYSGHGKGTQVQFTVPISGAVDEGEAKR